MDTKYNIIIAYNNILRRKKQVITNVALMILALIILLSTNYLANAMNNFVTDYILHSSHHKMLYASFPKSEKYIEEQIYDYANNDDRISEVIEAYNANVVKMLNVEELLKGTNINEKYCKIELIAGNQHISKLIVAGDYFDNDDTNVGVIPKYFYPDDSYHMGMFRDNRDSMLLNGEDFIGKEITIQYDSSEVDDEGTSKINGTYTYTFKVIGVYDNLKNMDEPNDVYISASDKAGIDKTIMSNIKGYAENYDKTLLVIINDYRDINQVMYDLESNCDRVSAYPVSVLNNFQYIGIYISLIGKIMAIIILGIAASIISLTTLNSIRKRMGEIGLLKAIGYKNKDIRKIMITESFLISCITIISGILIFIPLFIIMKLTIINYGSLFMSRIKLEIDIIWIIISLAIALIIPIASSISAIRESLKINPIEVLKNN